MRIVLARHGVTPGIADGRSPGLRDSPLAYGGDGEAGGVGLGGPGVPIHRAVSSPLSRARRTAELALGEARAAQLQLDKGLQEIAHGDWEGLLAAEIRERDPNRLRAWREAPETVQMPGGGESLVEVLDRAWPAFARACEGLGADDTLLVVAHDAVNRVILARVLGLPLSRLWSFRQAPTTINLLEGPTANALEVVRLNDCNHHTALFGEAVHRAL
ncbi:MAG: histidine phosphatase family protein [Rhizobium sp.]|nr:histidine phosphatase family protein [Rhizobium sp.]